MNKLAKMYTDSEGRKHIGGAGLTVPGALLATAGGAGLYGMSRADVVNQILQKATGGKIINPAIADRVIRRGKLGSAISLGLGAGALGGGITLSALKLRAKKRDMDKTAAPYVDSDGIKTYGGAGLTAPSALLAAAGGAGLYAMKKRKLMDNIKFALTHSPSEVNRAIKISKKIRPTSKAALLLGGLGMAGGIGMSLNKRKAIREDR